MWAGCGPGFRAGALAASAAVAGMAAPLFAQQFAPDAVAAYARQWRAAVGTHVAGEFDDDARLVASWPLELTQEILSPLLRVARTKPPDRDDGSHAAQSDARKVLDRALLLHTDIAIAERTTGVGRPVKPGRMTLRPQATTLIDGRPAAPTAMSRHWGVARLIADALAKDPARLPLVRTWYRAAGAFHQQSGDLGMLRGHLDAGLATVPDDPVLRLFEGTLHQGYADPRIQSHVDSFRDPLGRLPEQVQQQLGIERAEKELGMAERSFRWALEGDPSLVEARIRLAHVLGARGKPTEAAAIARETLQAPLAPFLEYYASMVLGRAETRLGRHGDARAAFERAAALYPQSQATLVALSHVALVEGRSADAVAALQRELAPSPSRAEDVWATYFRQHVPDARGYLDELEGMLR